MKKYIFVFSFLCFHLITAQKVILTYKLDYKIDTLQKNTNTELFTLIISDSISKFISNNQIQRDSIVNTLKNNPNQIFSAFSNVSKVPKTKFSFEIIKNFQTKVINFREQIYTNNYQYIENMKDFYWTLSNESKEINEYHCKKATIHYAGRDYIAWYTTEIPIFDGPYKFSGLPGLIIEIYDKDFNYYFHLVAVKKEKSFTNNNKNEKKYITVKKSKFIEIKNDFSDNRLNLIKQYGIQLSKEKEQSLIETSKTEKMNPLELIR